MTAPTMRRVDVPDESFYDPALNAILHTGTHAVEALRYMPHGAEIATDIETPGFDRAFTINCVTISWRDERQFMHSALLDVSRNDGHRLMCFDTYERASKIVLHNAPFDAPALYHADVLTDAHIKQKIVDSLVLARFAYPDPFSGKLPRKGLDQCAVKLLGWENHKGGLDLAFAAAGYSTRQKGFEGMDIDAPVYRRGAMADTIATLLIEPILRADGIAWTRDHPFVDHGARTDSDAAWILGVQERVHRIMLRRTAVGLAVDRSYLDTYAERVEDERRAHELTLAQAGLLGGVGKGKDIVDYLDSIGQLPEHWPRTPGGRLSSTKAHLEELKHPLADAQRGLAATEKTMGYIAKVARQSEVTGRCHPQVSTLGASQTGRMSYSMPELQQFDKDARAIITDDGQGLTSIDWSQIEPVTLALMAKDEQFLAPFEAGNDLYEPLMRAAGVDRDIAKRTLLGTMYGLGVRKLAVQIGHTEESAAHIKRQLLSAMPACEMFMANTEIIATQFGRIVTVGGRILPVHPDHVYKGVNYICQGSAYDVLAAAIVGLDDAGLGDHVQLAMHDEIVVDTEVAAEAQRIMETPPPFLTYWAGRTPVLRTDKADMQHHWAKV